MEVVQFFHASEIPKLLNHGQIKDGFHINLKLKKEFTRDLREAILEQKLFEVKQTEMPQATSSDVADVMAAQRLK
jgi:hypothetical protein